MQLTVPRQGELFDVGKQTSIVTCK